MSIHVRDMIHELVVYLEENDAGGDIVIYLPDAAFDLVTVQEGIKSGDAIGLWFNSTRVELRRHGT